MAKDRGNKPKVVGLTEAKMESRLRELCKLRGWLFYHTHDSRRSDKGFPDVVISKPDGSKPLFVELKVKTRLSREQCHWLTNLYDYAFVVRGLDDLELFEKYLCGDESRRKELEERLWQELSKAQEYWRDRWYKQ